MGAIIPNFKQHISWGVLLWVALAIGGLWTNPLGVLVGSVLPDADHRKSPIGKLVPLWLFFKHRGFTHTLWALGLISMVTWFVFGRSMAMGVALGYMSHLLLDAGTPMGIKWIKGHAKRTRFHRR